MVGLQSDADLMRDLIGVIEKSEFRRMKRWILGSIWLSLGLVTLEAILLLQSLRLTASIAGITSYATLIAAFVRYPRFLQLFRGWAFTVIILFVGLMAGGWATLAAGSMSDFALAAGSSQETYVRWLAPFFEEPLKIGGVLVLVLNFRRLGMRGSAPVGLLLAGALWAGYVFGLIETSGNPSYMASLIPRLLGSIPSHSVWSFIFGSAIIFGGLRLSSPQLTIGAPILGYTTAASLHALWNQSFFSTYAMIVVLTTWLVLVLAMGVWIWSRRRSPGSQARALK